MPLGAMAERVEFEVQAISDFCKNSIIIDTPAPPRLLGDNDVGLISRGVSGKTRSRRPSTRGQGRCIHPL